MKTHRFALTLLAGALTPLAAWAQAAPNLAVGTTVYGPQNGEVGKIESINADTVVVDTGTSKATLPKSAFGAGTKGPTVTITKAQIDAAVANSLAKSEAALDAALIAGAEVRGKGGSLIGTVKEVAGDLVTVDRTAGPVSLKRAMFTNVSGTLRLTLTSAELDAAAKAASATTGGEQSRR